MEVWNESGSAREDNSRLKPSRKELRYNCVVKGSMIFGFGMVAYPAVYGASGIMPLS